MTIATELAERIHALTYEDLPPEAVYWAKAGVLDTIGVTLAGSSDPASTILRETLPETPGASLVYGAGRRTTALDAALLNGTTAHALDFDDASDTLGGHPSVPILPALLALADEIGASGQDFLTAYVAGYETECKISMGVNFYQYTHGWHPTSTIGVFGAAAACSRLLGLSAGQTATALAIAASMAAGIKANFGSMVKPLHVGNCSRSGLLAALLAGRGFTGTTSAFEHPQGYFEVFNGPGNYDAERILPAWANPFDIVSPGIALKQYPCCGSTHPAIDAALALAQEHDIDPADVARVQSWTHTRRLQHTNRPDPQSPEDAAFSVQYCVARALADRRVVIEDFEEGAYRQPEVRQLMSRVEAAPYTTAQFPAENHFGAEVTVTLKDGRSFSHKVDEALGRTSANPLSAQAIEAKFSNCAGRVLPSDRVEQLYETVQSLPTVRDVRALGAIIEG